MLNVRTVLRGSVRVQGARVHLSVRLADAVTGAQLWSQRFAREWANVFGMQEDVAVAVCRELGLAPRPEQRPGGHTRGHSEAYALYLKGRYCLNRRTELTLQKSVTYFEAAVAKDPEYAPAQTALAEATATLGLYGVFAPHDIMPRSRAAAIRAIELAPDNPAAHATAACIAAVYDWDWANAAQSYHRAMEIGPSEPLAHHWYAINYLVPLRRFEEAAAELQRAADADPLSMPVRVTFGLRSYFAHDFARAERELRECLEFEAGAATARLFLGLTLVEMKRTDEAIREIETALQLALSPEATAALAYACARGGQLERARGLLGRLLLDAHERYVSPSLIAQVHAGFGSVDLVLEWLERAVDVRAVDLAWLGVRPVFDDLRADPRFNALLNRIQPQF
jgi:serine/threonine-protein kinase